MTQKETIQETFFDANTGETTQRELTSEELENLPAAKTDDE